VFLISPSVSFSLASPVVDIIRRSDPSMPAFMLVPETAVNEDNFLTRNEDNVGLAWKILAMERVTIA
jgi:hypothetical protein